ncbi:GGDEF domain-containing protein [Desulfonema magnum]|nr:GGDEF domain-containing protein [Desulfonema magnum]
MINIGIIIIDKELKVYKWNRWMEIHSKIPAEKITGFPLFSFFPDLNNPRFLRNFKSVLTFGNFAFFSQKLHQYLFPFQAANSLGSNFKYMRQSCTMGPLRDDNNVIRYAYIMVQDVTDIAAYEQKLLEMSIRDGLTGVYNRRYFETRLEEEFERHKRYTRPFSIIMQDIDHFKKVNDTYGHPCGDYILKAFASMIVSSIRKVDIFARYGGEEFCCLLPETRLDSAMKLAEFLRKKIERNIFIFNNTEIRITISQGIAELKTEMGAAEALLREADHALYEAKESGRNKVVKMKD